MATPDAKRQKLEMNGVNGSNSRGHGYGFDVALDYDESSVSFNLPHPTILPRFNPLISDKLIDKCEAACC